MIKIKQKHEKKPVTSNEWKNLYNADVLWFITGVPIGEIILIFQ